MADPKVHRTASGGGVLEIERTRDGDAARLALHGDLDLGSGRALLDAVEQALASGARGVVEIDLTGLGFVDSSGMSALVSAARRIHAHGARLETTAPAGHEARLLLDLAGLESVVGLRDA